MGSADLKGVVEKEAVKVRGEGREEEEGK